jgi:hypothetical protein
MPPKTRRTDPVRTLQWKTAACNIRIGRVTLFSAAQTMNLDLGVDINTLRSSGRSAYVIRAPALEAATFRLRFAHTRAAGGEMSDPRRLSQDLCEREHPGRPDAELNDRP